MAMIIGQHHSNRKNGKLRQKLSTYFVLADLTNLILNEDANFDSNRHGMGSVLTLSDEMLTF